MAAFFVFDENITDPVSIQEYVRLAGPILKRYGGKVLTAGGTIQALEGDWQPNPLVILEFESMEQARQWYFSDEYASIKIIRQKASKTRLVLVEGTQGVQWTPESLQESS